MSFKSHTLDSNSCLRDETGVSRLGERLVLNGVDVLNDGEHFNRFGNGESPLL